MKATNRPTTTRSDRATIAIVTCGFILLSGVFHMIMGGIIRPIQFKTAPEPSITEIVFRRLESPKPTTPPTPAPSPTPRPKAPQIVRHPEARPSVVSHPFAQPHAVVVPQVQETSTATAGDGDQPAAPTGAAQPAAAPSPTDYRYVVVSARFIHRVDPIYPQDAMGGDEEGTVIILLTIGPDGVSDVRVWETSGYPVLDRAALEAAKESTYSVPEVNGEPVTETYRIIYTFALNS